MLPDESVDASYSRFRMMALSDPVAAFSNFHQMLKATGRLTFVCWRSLHENELDDLPLRAAALEHLADTKPFNFRASSYVRDVLKKAGFQNISIIAHDEAVTCGNLDAMLIVLLKAGTCESILNLETRLRSASERHWQQKGMILNASLYARRHGSLRHKPTRARDTTMEFRHSDSLRCTIYATGTARVIDKHGLDGVHKVGKTSRGTKPLRS